ncbi:hypothetical protein ES707_16840 [subsurface metagenome]
MNINSIITKDYRKKDDFAVRINKPNSKPISEKPKMNVNSLITKDYRKNDVFADQKTNPIQTQSKPVLSAACPERSRMGRMGQFPKGHPPHLPELLPPEKVMQRIELKPQVCPCGGVHFEQCNQEPLRHQIIDIPPIVPEVTEYLQQVYRCKDCGELVYASLPDKLRRQHFGPGVLAMVAVLTGMLNTSKRKALTMMNEVFSVPMSLGGLSNCEAQLADALEQPYSETLEHIREQDVAHADETGWRRGNRQRGWLWTFCCAGAAVFMVHAKRGQQAARKSLGVFSGTLVSDRWGGYNFFTGPRQICWAHLKRDFKAMSEDLCARNARNFLGGPIKRGDPPI